MKEIHIWLYGMYVRQSNYHYTDRDKLYYALYQWFLYNKIIHYQDVALFVYNFFSVIDDYNKVCMFVISLFVQCIWKWLFYCMLMSE